jgi:hypothetical protein
MTPDQVKASVVAKVTGKLGPVPPVDPELSQALLNSEHDRIDAEFAPMATDVKYQRLALEMAGPAPEKTVFTAELQEAFDSYKLGYPNVLMYRAYKALEMRVNKLEEKQKE